MNLNYHFQDLFRVLAATYEGTNDQYDFLNNKIDACSLSRQ